MFWFDEVWEGKSLNSVYCMVTLWDDLSSILLGIYKYENERKEKKNDAFETLKNFP